MSTSSNEQWTVERLLRWTTDYLKQRGADSARLDAEVLLAHALDCQRIDLYTAFDQIASDEARTTFRELVRQRVEGVPVAYLVGYREFYSLPFRVTRDVLIPRPETEQLVLEMLDRAKAMPSSLAIADVGTGSGIIAICAAKYLPEARVLATDISEAALAIAAENAERHEVASRIEWLPGDLLSPLPAALKLDLVVSNPPYVSEAEFAQLAVDVKDHEPRVALVAGPKGIEVIQQLVIEAAERLNVGGWLLAEISPMIESSVRALLADNPSFGQLEILPDLAGLARIVRTRRI